MPKRPRVEEEKCPACSQRDQDIARSLVREYVEQQCFNGNAKDEDNMRTFNEDQSCDATPDQPYRELSFVKVRKQILHMLDAYAGPYDVFKPRAQWKFEPDDEEDEPCSACSALQKTL